MQVRVLFFGGLKDIFQQDGRKMELATGARVADLVVECRRLALPPHQPASPGAASIWNAIAVAVNQQYVLLDHPLQDDDEVALLPPVSGGAPGGEVRLTRTAIDTERVVASMKDTRDGALVVFDGVVRDNSRGRRTLYLDYEAYEAMALVQMQQLATQAKQQFAVRAVALIHRLGRLQIGETAVLIVVASAHRDAAFDACRWIIDTLKTTVPIWKKEFFEDGAVWPAGEPFPAALRTGEGV